VSGAGRDPRREPEDAGGTRQLHDCVVIGAGPAGLTAALYLRRFHRDIAVLDAGNSRARWIPSSHNCPGFPDGVSGDDLLARMREQASDYGTLLKKARATRLEKVEQGFLVHDAQGGQYLTRTVLLATGLVDVLPEVDWAEPAVACGAMRLCAICDGFEASDEDLAVYGPLPSAFGHARFMRSYSARVTLVPSSEVEPDQAMRDAARQAGIEMLQRPRGLVFEDGRCGFVDASGHTRWFDTVYPVLGGRSQSALAIELGARVDEASELVVDRDQMTSVEGLYAVGDVVSALNQISVGIGHAAIAATHIHNALPRNPRAAGAHRTRGPRLP